jgi:hypothetical protein
MAGSSAITITPVTYNSSDPAYVKFRLMSSAAGWYLNVGGKEGSKVIFLVASESTAVAAGTTVYVGTSDTATTGTSYANTYSGSKRGRMKIKTAKTTKGSSYARFRSTATTKLMHLMALGPFETARFKTSNGYIRLAKGKTGSTRALIGAILLP